ncbi:putative mitochondrial protein AtMg00310 [Silene latifolia]|uniref:putative mitochondrial protein AtMg00310 n=1 Tax=Silene latifolia TaxID=37657 RepID=UPI003D778D39
MAWLSWDKLCKPKDRGGLGFRDFNKFNRALLGKQGWRLMTSGDALLTRILKGKYFPNKEFMEADLGSSQSYTWRSMWEVQDVIKLGARRRIGDGKTTRVWIDPWILGSHSKCALSTRGNAELDMMVADLMLPGEMRCNVRRLIDYFYPSRLTA